jgi:hypothetical protein
MVTVGANDQADSCFACKYCYSGDFNWLSLIIFKYQFAIFKYPLIVMATTDSGSLPRFEDLYQDFNVWTVLIKLPNGFTSNLLIIC